MVQDEYDGEPGEGILFEQTFECGIETDMTLHCSMTVWTGDVNHPRAILPERTLPEFAIWLASFLDDTQLRVLLNEIRRINGELTEDEPNPDGDETGVVP